MAAGNEAQQSTPVYLGALLDDGEGATVTLVAGQTRLVVHRAVLVAGSPVFAAMFRHDTAESRGGLVDVADVEGPVLRELLTYLYTLRAPQLASLAPRLLAAADKYGVASLKAQCEQQLAAGLTVDNAAATAVLAVRHCCPGLRQTAVSYIKGHTHRVMATQGWADAVRTQPEDVVELGKMLAETPPESSSPASPGPSAATQPPRGAAARHTPPPPDDAAVSRLRSLSQQERGRRLIEAAKQGAVEQLRELLAAGADVGAREEGWWGGSWTALHWAAERGHVAAASCLVGAGAEVDALCPGRGTVCPSSRAPSPLHSAVPATQSGHTAWRRSLPAQRLPRPEKHGIAESLSQQERGRRLIEAAKQGAVEQLRELLAAGADVGAREEGWWGGSWTALHWAAERGHVAAASCLVGAGAEVDARDSLEQYTPLHWAAYYGHAGVVRLLLGASADPNARDLWGRTPLHWAAEGGQAGAAAELLLAGADRGARDDKGRTPLDLVRKRAKGTVQNTAAVAASEKAFPRHAPAADSPRGVTVSGWGEAREPAVGPPERLAPASLQHSAVRRTCNFPSASIGRQGPPVAQQAATHFQIG
ncbi:serine/threonine-protein phosphatase 6 regulatory ankyrin repeat subunit A-like [Schistocerca cancellata]|uniref:serine/threonine-protein phosphatase 6 regulatory ankyrin repeat subunit A-like n=1 Tax=Schistocerca cancellata TaxID=274614 RepID=UPI0021187F3B|nr:serine/threonine-protein phosphatase 6 regulatory ankyrin repeat subunit A-like [Schistocerca cancellata]